MALPYEGTNTGNLWVFAYGSLMWRPGFPFFESRVAHIQGYHRSFCVLSHVHRGTVDRPGLVLGLDQGGSCTGIAYRVADEYREQTIDYLREREQVTNVYIEKYLPAEAEVTGPVSSLAYIVDRAHHQYAGNLPDEEKLALIRDGVGVSGTNPDYVRSTYEQLRRIGIEDKEMARLVADL